LGPVLLFRVFFGHEIVTQLCGDYFINQYFWIRIEKKQDDSWKVPGRFFLVAQGGKQQVEPELNIVNPHGGGWKMRNA